jgi:hypothetical protein
MQELSTIVPAHKKQTIIEIAVRNIYELWLGLAKDTMRSVRQIYPLMSFTVGLLSM